MRGRHRVLLFADEGTTAVKPQITKAANAKHTPPTPEQIRAQQRADAERQLARQHAAAAPAAKPATTLPAKPAVTAVAPPDDRTAVQKYLDDVAPATIVGRLVKFNKNGEFETADDEEKIGEDADFIALCDQTLVGWIKFNGDGEPPDRVAGLLYDGFVLPARETLGDRDESKWELGPDKATPQDPWQSQACLVLQRGDTAEMYTFATTSKTGRRAIGNLLRHYNRMEKARANAYPVVKLKSGGFNHRDPRVGWVSVPVLAVVGRHPKDDAAKPDSSLAGDMSDRIPF